MISAEGTLPLFISEVFENLPKIEGGETANEEFVQLLALLMGQYASQDFISPRTIHLQDRENGHQLPFAGKKLPLPPAATPDQISSTPELPEGSSEQIHEINPGSGNLFEGLKKTGNCNWYKPGSAEFHLATYRGKTEKVQEELQLLKSENETGVHHKSLKPPVNIMFKTEIAVESGPSSSEHTSKTLHRENNSALPEIQSTKPEQIHLRDLHQLFSIGSARAIPGQSPGSTLLENTLEMPFGHSAWDHAMGKKILFMVKQDVGQAKLHLNPPELGRVEIKVSVFRNIANVTFLAEHAGVRNALETAIPRLEAMFRDAGLNLMSVDISHQAFDGQHRPPTHSGSGSGPLNPDMVEHEVSSSGPKKDLMQMETGLIDFYV